MPIANQTDPVTISVITVTYNARFSLEQTISSVIHQSYSDIEFIIIDGGSTDGTVEVIKQYEDKLAYWISEADEGAYDAMNKALDKITGDWVYFLGSGDMLVNVLDKVADLLINNNYIYYGNVYRKDLLSVYDGKFSASKFAVSNICHQAIFYPASVFKKYHYDRKYKMQADYALNMLCFGDKNYKFKYLAIIVCLYEGEGISDKILDYPFFEDKMKLIRANFNPAVYFYAWVRRTIARLLKSKYKNK